MKKSKSANKLMIVGVKVIWMNYRVSEVTKIGSSDELSAYDECLK